MSESYSLPKPFMSPQPGVPGSPRRRRELLQSIDDNDCEMSIEAFIYRTDDYRSTSVQIPYPRPLYLTGPTDTLKYRLFESTMICINCPSTKLRDDICIQLHRHQINVLWMHFFSQSKPGYPQGGDEIVQGLHVGVDVQEGSQRGVWSQAMCDIQSLLEEDGLSDIEIEICDDHRCYEPVLLPIVPNDPHIKAYESVRRELLECAHEKLGDSLSSMCIYKVKANWFLKSTIDVVLTVDPFTKHNWTGLQRSLRSILCSATDECNLSIGVQIIPGEAGFAVPLKHMLNQQMHGERYHNTYVSRDLPHTGASIGVEHSLGGGTLGGYMTIELAGKTHRGFLTSSNVVAPSESTPEQLGPDYDQRGVSMQDDESDPIRTKVHWMAINDIEAIRDSVTASRVVVAAWIRELDEQAAGGEQTEKERRDLEMRRDLRTKDSLHLDAMEKFCSSMPKPMGKVLFSTGKALSASNHILDVAFVEISETDKTMWDHCVLGDMLPDQCNGDFHYRLPEYYGLDRRHVPCLTTGVSPIVKGDWYFKVGRETDLTAGICHGTEAYVRLEGKRSQYDNLGRRGEYTDTGFTEEFVILSSQTKRPWGKLVAPTPFCDRGDAGAFIINCEGKVVAQLFGFIKGMCGVHHSRKYTKEGVHIHYAATMGLMTPMDRIVENVKLLTAPKDPSTGEHTGPGAVLDGFW